MTEKDGRVERKEACHERTRTVHRSHSARDRRVGGQAGTAQAQGKARRDGSPRALRGAGEIRKGSDPADPDQAQGTDVRIGGSVDGYRCWLRERLERGQGSDQVGDGSLHQVNQRRFNQKTELS